MNTVFSMMMQKMSRQILSNENKLLVKIGITARNYFESNFDNEGFDNQKWQPSKRKRDGRSPNPTLTGRGNLRKSIVFQPPKNGSVTIETIGIPTKNGNTNDYARVHNEGLRSGRGSGFTMPKRKFIGDSDVLSKKIKRIIEKSFFK